MKFPFYKQYDMMDCGPSSLRMIAKYYGKHYTLEYLRTLCHITRNGVNLLGISEAAEKIGLRTLAVKIDSEKLVNDAPLPCILYWNQNHFVVLHNIKKGKYFIADPGHSLLELNEKEFLNSWKGTSKEGIALLLEPSSAFYEKEDEETVRKKGFKFLFSYLRPYKRYVYQLFLSMLFASALSLLFPFLTQSLVDNGIEQRNIGFIQLILISQLVLFISGIFIELIRSWILLHINSRINISIISDFLMKLMRLPIKYFDSKHVGDIKQRIADHNRIQSFLTGNTLSTLFSFVTLIVYTAVLSVYSLKILSVFVVFSLLGIGWIMLFLKRRKHLDYVRFQKLSENESALYELITGMQDIKLNNCETTKRWGWERIQAKLFYLNIKNLTLGQSQLVGSRFFNQLKNIIITFISANEVIHGNMTLGMMMSVSYIIGQLNSPVDQILGFVQSAQDARISLDRISEIHDKEDEEKVNAQIPLSILEVGNTGNIKYEDLLHAAPPDAEMVIESRPTTKRRGICFENVSYQYEGPESPFVLKDVSIHIPKGKVTAIVGSSGSGKTTLLKMLLKFYDPVKGDVTVDGNSMKDIPPSWWRSKCGVVMQEGFLFNDTIAGNVAACDENPDHVKLKRAVHMANIHEHIEGLPLSYNTKIGNLALGLSVGQKQRILIARAVYKNPDYLFFDEATSALDANNEKIIMQNMEEFYRGKTVVIIAHRLSTVKNADQIIVLEKGRVVEVGNHTSLVQEKGYYYELVKNQLELGN